MIRLFSRREVAVGDDAKGGAVSVGLVDLRKTASFHATQASFSAPNLAGDYPRL